MILNMTVFDRRNTNRGTARLQLDFLTKQWSIPEGECKGWQGVGFSYPARGFFELRQNGWMWLWDQHPKSRCPVEIWQPPESEADFRHRSGEAVIREPRDPAFQQGRIKWSLASRATGLTSLRRWVLDQLSELTGVLTDENKQVASNDNKTKDLFNKWTGYTQEELVTKWTTKEGFTKAADPKAHGGRVFYREDANGKPMGGPTTTCCEAVVNKLLGRIRNDWFSGKPPIKRTPVGSFNLAGLNQKTGQEPATTVGWHWWKEKTASLKPQPGDLFQVGKLLKPGQWSLRHVGIITHYIDGVNPIIRTVEGGQGGPASGFDAIKCKGPRPINPVDKKDVAKVFMGWLNIDEYFSVPMALL